MRGRPGAVEGDLAADVAKWASSDPQAFASWARSPLDHRVENMTTRSLERRSGRLPDGRPTSIVVKALQPASAHPAFAEIPPPFRAEVLEDLHWLDEPDLYRCGLGSALPEPLRMPTVYAVHDEEEQVTIWMEDVADVTPWDLERYHRTAEALGALAGRWQPDEAASRFGLHGRDIGRMFFGKILHEDVPALADDAFWDDPLVAEVAGAEHRRGLRRLVDVVPRLLARTEPGPKGVCHGDATPDNFREPGDGSIVALDWSYGHVGHVGTDLAQLLAGRFESGAAQDLEPTAVVDVALTGYLEGVARMGRHVEVASVRRALALHLAIRSAFSALRVDHRRDLASDEQRRALLAPRARIGRFAVDLALSVG